MTDRIAFWLAAVLAVLIGADFALTGGETLVFLARKFFDLMDWVAFWR
ncbi:glyceraldehyde-3-phosphate dehydrogenase [Rhodobacter sp. SGA-6-6]|nr:glyceraldehyde-3-phosphate dehydrogenase [Rhodobacter sp. SGA-6-6]NGM47254.1 glyceraldehyde-3-phosphate dehydrogenase [Rhodobacter sp. SGA-6-6]